MKFTIYCVQPALSNFCTNDRFRRICQGNRHRNIPDDLARIRIEHTLKDLSCPCGCGNQLHKISEVVTEQLEIVPAKIYVKQHVRFKYAGCKHQNKVVTAPMPNQPIDKGFAGPGLLADVAHSKLSPHSNSGFLFGKKLVRGYNPSFNLGGLSHDLPALLIKIY